MHVQIISCSQRNVGQRMGRLCVYVCMGYSGIRLESGVVCLKLQA